MWISSVNGVKLMEHVVASSKGNSICRQSIIAGIDRVRLRPALVVAGTFGHCAFKRINRHTYGVPQAELSISLIWTTVLEWLAHGYRMAECLANNHFGRGLH